jgi:hypothetical protein
MTGLSEQLRNDINVKKVSKFGFVKLFLSRSEFTLKECGEVFRICIGFFPVNWFAIFEKLINF